jgi:hypothetical protein
MKSSEAIRKLGWEAWSLRPVGPEYSCNSQLFKAAPEAFWRLPTAMKEELEKVMLQFVRRIHPPVTSIMNRFDISLEHYPDQPRGLIWP